ncbi:Ribulose bisphosphate carboxylase small chain 1A-chloroplastic [Striga hermonthica]|uniref:Ribulose bisphosphate carboxylase small subunit, chloroplastic n=1 Tax=Striga hermonthica TaxID=68872 RepID=A0A9N7MXD6_STRHE|nr:Ribulose bisphosphate carboxylase small chain 1A-chloroplastic [Striga hermonthica]
MATSMISTTAPTVGRSASAQPVVLSPFLGFRSTGAFPGTPKHFDITSITSNGGRVKCMKVWPTVDLKKFETLSYLPPLTTEQLIKQIDYLLKQKLIPCLEFELQHGFPYRENNRSPGYYDGRYWTMWKLPMFGCTDAVQVVNELNEAVRAHPDGFIRIIGFDNVRQVQIIAFIAYKPPGY